MTRSLASLRLDLEIAALSLRWVWNRMLFYAGCFMAGILPAEVRRRHRLRELTGRHA
jgi:hypothetical protein